MANIDRLNYLIGKVMILILCCVWIFLLPLSQLPGHGFSSAGKFCHLDLSFILFTFLFVFLYFFSFKFLGHKKTKQNKKTHNSAHTYHGAILARKRKKKNKLSLTTGSHLYCLFSFIIFVGCWALFLVCCHGLERETMKGKLPAMECLEAVVDANILPWQINVKWSEEAPTLLGKPART